MPEMQCNGLVLFEVRKLVSFDIFGNREVYHHYFEKLAGDAMRRDRNERGEGAIGEAEAFYRLDEFLDAFESRLESQLASKTGSIGQFRWSGDPEFPGFELTFEDHPVHMVGFAGY